PCLRRVPRTPARPAVAAAAHVAGSGPAPAGAGRAGAALPRRTGWGGEAMTAAMPEVLAASLLALAALLTCARLLHGHLRRDRTQPPTRWKLPLLLMAQPLLAALLFFGLFPPARPLDAGVMTVYTAGANPAAAGAGT